MSKLTLTPIELLEIASPATPASGRVLIYAKDDGVIYQKDDAGIETSLAGGGGGSADEGLAMMGGM